MGDHGTGQKVAARIGFAEQWLQRAKGQVSGGQLARGVLTLVLADAEVRHAMEMAGAPLHTSRRPRLAAPLLVAATFVTAVALALARPMAGPAPAVVEGGPPILRLGDPAGALVNFVATPPAAVPTAAPARVRDSVGPVIRPSKRGAINHIGPTVVPAVPAVSTTSTPVAPPPAPSVIPAAAPPVLAPGVSVGLPPSTGTVLTSGELIDLVLAAERALRGDQTRR